MKKTLNNVVVLILFLKNNSYIIDSSNVFFIHIILMDTYSKLLMNLGEVHLVTKNSNE